MGLAYSLRMEEKLHNRIYELNMLNRIIFVIFGITLITIISIPEAFAQYIGTGEIYDSQPWSDKVELLLQDHLETKLIPNQNIINDTIKTRISGSPEDISPPRFHIRIIYDLLENNNTKHMDLVYKVDFGQFAKTPDSANLVKLYEKLYIPPGQIFNKKFEESPSYLTGMLQNIMCRQGFEKIIKNADGTPACVKSGSVQKLIERGWAKS